MPSGTVLRGLASVMLGIVVALLIHFVGEAVLVTAFADTLASQAKTPPVSSVGLIVLRFANVLLASITGGYFAARFAPELVRVHALAFGVAYAGMLGVLLRREQGLMPTWWSVLAVLAVPVAAWSISAVATRQTAAA